MKNTALFFAILFVVFLNPNWTEAQSRKKPKQEAVTGIVIRVLSPQVFQMRISSQETCLVRIRDLEAIFPEDPMFEYCRQKLSSLIGSRKVRVFSAQKVEPYVLNGYVQSGSVKNVTLEMIKNGWGLYLRDGDSDLLLKAEKAAKKRKAGYHASAEEKEKMIQNAIPVPTKSALEMLDELDVRVDVLFPRNYFNEDRVALEPLPEYRLWIDSSRTTHNVECGSFGKGRGFHSFEPTEKSCPKCGGHEANLEKCRSFAQFKKLLKEEDLAGCLKLLPEIPLKKEGFLNFIALNKLVLDKRDKEALQPMTDYLMTASEGVEKEIYEKFFDILAITYCGFQENDAVKVFLEKMSHKGKIEYYDTTLPLLSRAKIHVESKIDEMEDMAWYSSTRECHYESGYEIYRVNPYFGLDRSTGKILFRIYTSYLSRRTDSHSPDWIFYDRIQFLGLENQARLLVVPGSRKETEVEDYGLREWADVLIDLEEFEKLMEASTIRVKFYGKYSHEFKLSTEQYRMFEEILAACQEVKKNGKLGNE
ncbi:MAG: hypothetical protein J6A23_11890 [Thermoguttaceae bacterium]|nr:hypothetical protein [Thermoguttaceae bacterium]